VSTNAAWGGGNVLLQRVLIPGELCIDASKDDNARGIHVPDGFVAKNYNVLFELNRPTTPDCLIGRATKDIQEGENLLAPSRQAFWVQKAAIKSLPETKKAACKKMHKSTEKEYI
jgi:hypothetical protein